MPGGVIAHIDLSSAFGGLDIRRMTFQEIIFVGAYTYTDQDFRTTAQAIFEKRLRPLDCTKKKTTARWAKGLFTTFVSVLPSQRLS